MFGEPTRSDFGGAYYRKVSSQEKREYFGIRGEGFLPLISFDKDPGRYFRSKDSMDHFKTGPMDRPSVYFGGHASGKEVDAGLSWDRVWKTRDVATYTDLETWCHGGHLENIFTFSNGKVIDGSGNVVADGLSRDEFHQRFHPNFAFRPFWRTTNPGDQSGGWHNPKPGAEDNLYFFPGRG